MGDLLARIERQRAGWALEADFDLDAAITAVENQALWHRRWLPAAHGCELAAAGAFVTRSIADEPVVVVRGHDGFARAFANVGRHHGSRVCSAASGRVLRLACPYDAWRDDLDGRLLSDVSGAADTLGLHPYATHAVGGLIFVSLAERPEDIALLDRTFAPQLAPQGLARASLAR